MTLNFKYISMPTSQLVKLVARGASSPEDQDAAEAELDRRIPTYAGTWTGVTCGHLNVCGGFPNKGMP